MLDLITAENGLSYGLLWKWYSIFIEAINTSVNSVLRHRILIYFTGTFFQCATVTVHQFFYILHSSYNFIL